MTYTQLINLPQMENTVRRITARYTEAQMPTSQIDYYLNLAYTLHFPLQFKNLKLTKPYVFTTIPNVDTYDFPYEQGDQFLNANLQPIPGNIQVTPPVYCQGYILKYYQDKSIFYNRWPQLTVNQQIGVGSGQPSTTYSGTIPSTPFYRAQLDAFGKVTNPGVYISAYDSSGDATSGFNYVITDVPQDSSDVGFLYDDENNKVGTVNYITGAYTFLPAAAAEIPDTANIYAAVVPYIASRPVEVLFYNQQFVFRPCPQQVYNVEFQVSQQPTQLMATGQTTPELDEWYLLLCCIAADLIYIDFPDPQGRAENKITLMEQIGMAQRRTLRQLGSQRAQTIFSTPGWSRNWGAYFYGSEYSGSQ